MKKEKEIIEGLLREAGVDEKKIIALGEVIENVAYMKIKLKETRKAIKKGQVVIEYDNGGGQKGIRENPMFKGYEALWKSYIAGMKIIIDEMPDGEPAKEEMQKPQNMIEMIRARKMG